MKSGKTSWFTLAGLAVVGTMAYMFVAPKLFTKAAAAPSAAPSAPVASQGVLPQALPGNATMPPQSADLDMSFAGVTFPEQVPGLSYGFPLTGIV